MVAITNASPNKAWQELKVYAPGEAAIPHRGIEIRGLANGGILVRIHYSADPSKDPSTRAGAAWYAVEYSRSPVREWLREMEMKEDVYDGEPVYGDYDDALHCLAQTGSLPVVKGSLYIGGWDCGQTLNPAFVLLQITPKPWQVHALLEVLAPGAEAMETFAPRVMRALQKILPGHWDEVQHWGDTTVKQRSGSNGETAQDVARKHGVRIRESSNEWAGRVGSVTWLLTDQIDEDFPRFQIDGVRCPTLREGFKGAYKVKETAAGERLGADRVLAMPVKDGYSHVQDALQYAAMRAKRLIKSQRIDS